MSWKSTLLLVCLAALLFGFIYGLERFVQPAAPGFDSPRELLPISSADVNSVQLRRTNQFLLRAERAGNRWNLTAPLFYPAQSPAIENILQLLEGLTSRTLISTEELAASRRTIAEFGLDVPLVTVTLQQRGRRFEISFGSKTPAGDQVYAQVLNLPGIFVVNGEIFDRLPWHANQWRDTSVYSLDGLNVDRMEVRLPGRSYAINVDATNKVFFLSKPSVARADTPKVEALLRKLQSGRVTRFVTDDPRTDLDPMGLQTPEAELIFGQGTNDSVVLQFGRSPTNDPSLVYVRRLAQTNVVLAPKSLLDALQIAPNDLRDLHLMSFAPEAVDTVEVTGTSNLPGFAVRRQVNGMWVVIEAQATLLDPELMRELLAQLTRLEGRVEKDLVTDFSAYGLAPPLRQYLLKTTLTNSAGVLTNRVVAQLDIGGRQGEKVFARRGDEGLTVYSFNVADLERLPISAWQLRDRRVWSFTTNQVVRVTIRDQGYTRQLLRNPTGTWSLATGSTGFIKNTDALEETIFRLGELRAAAWTARGEEHRSLYGFKDDGLRLTFELKVGDKPYNLNLEFGGFAPSQYPYALATIDGQAFIFEFPIPLYYQVLRDLRNPPLRNPT